MYRIFDVIFSNNYTLRIRGRNFIISLARYLDYVFLLLVESKHSFLNLYLYLYYFTNKVTSVTKLYYFSNEARKLLSNRLCRGWIQFGTYFSAESKFVHCDITIPYQKLCIAISGSVDTRSSFHAGGVIFNER